MPTLAEYSDSVGRRFRALTAEGTFELELIEATALPAHRGAPRQDPFSLLFRAPTGYGLQQGTVTLESDTTGAVDAFLVPVGAEHESVLLEAIFN
jgi:hypothetical protein